jgi:hypothetical protein
MKTNPTPPKAGKGRVRLTRTFSLYPRHEALLSAEAQARVADRGRTHGVLSVIIQELIDEGLGGKAGGRFKRQPSTFREDCVETLRKAGLTVAENTQVGSHEVDILVTKAKKHCIVVLSERTREQRLENTLGTAMLLKSETGHPVVVCTPYILDRSLAKAFEYAGSCLCDPSGLTQAVVRMVGG